MCGTYRALQQSSRALLVATIIAMPQAAAAAPTEEPIIVLKTRIDSASGTDRELAALIDDEFEAAGFAARRQTIAQILGGRMPHPGIRDPGLTAAEIIRTVELGYDDWTHGLPDNARAKLEPALDKMSRNPALLVTDTKNLDVMFKGMVALAMSTRKSDFPFAQKTMLDLVRMFPNRAVSRLDYGRPAEEFHRVMSQEASRAGASQLVVTAGHDQAVIFIDSQIRGIGKAAVANTLPGSHKIFIQVPSTRGLQFEVDAKAHQETRLHVEWEAETSLSITDQWIGFVFASDMLRNKEALYAGQLATQWSGRGMVVVLSALEHQREALLMGTLYRAGGKVVRHAGITLRNDRRASIRDLALFLAHGKPSERLNLVSPDDSRRIVRKAPAASKRRWGWVLPSTVMVAGAATMIGGGVMYARTEGGAYSDNRASSVEVMTGGAVMLGGSVYLWLRESTRASRLSAAAIAAGTSAMIAGAQLYLVDQNPLPEEPIRIRNSAPYGAAFAISGAVLTGVGVWLFARDAKPAATAMPALSPSASRMIVGYTGAF